MWKLKSSMLFGTVTFLCVIGLKGSDIAPIHSGTLLFWAELGTQNGLTECMMWGFWGWWCWFFNNKEL